LLCTPARTLTRGAGAAARRCARLRRRAPVAGLRADGRGARGAAAGDAPCARDALFLHCQALAALASALRGRAPAALRALGAAALRLAAARGSGSAHAAVAAADVACAARDWAGLAMLAAELQVRPRAWLQRVALQHGRVKSNDLLQATTPCNIKPSPWCGCRLP
jgi:hypothetical protein